MSNFADRIADAILSHTVDLSRYDVTLRAQIVGMLEDLRDDLTLRTSRIDPTSPKAESVRVKRQQQLLQDADKTIKRAYEGIKEHSEKSLFEVGKVVVEGTANKINALVGVDLTSASLNAGTLKALINGDIVVGAPAKYWWDRQSQNTRDNFIRQIRLGMMGGENLGQILQRVRGEHTGRYLEVQDEKGRKRKVPEFSGGVLSASTREASALVRTAVQSVANSAREEFYRENPETIKGFQALVTLDGRTSDLCKARSGKSWDLEGNPLPGTDSRFPGPPPWHFNCRSTLIPVLKSWKELAGPKSQLSQRQLTNLEKKMSPETQSSMDGQVAGDLTYESWLKTKPEAFQRQVLGPGRYDLWRQGKLEFSDLVDQSGNPLTLAQLRADAGIADDILTLPTEKLRARVGYEGDVFRIASTDRDVANARKFGFWANADFDADKLVRFLETTTNNGEPLVTPARVREIIEGLADRSFNFKSPPNLSIEINSNQEVVRVFALERHAEVIYAARALKQKVSMFAPSRLAARQLNRHLGDPPSLKNLDIPDIRFFGPATNLADKESLSRMEHAITSTIQRLDGTFPNFRVLFNGNVPELSVDVGAVSKSQYVGVFRHGSMEISFSPNRRGGRDLSKIRQQKTGVMKLGSARWTVGNGSLEDVTAHEVGHAVHYGIHHGFRNAGWLDIYEKVKAMPGGWAAAVSRYGATNEKEAFAEAFGAFTNPVYLKGQLPKIVEDFMSRLLGKARNA